MERNLSIAIALDDVNRVTTLLASGVDVNGGVEYPKPISTAIELHRLTILKLLIQAGANVDNIISDNYMSYTPLTYAIRMDVKEAVEILVNAGAKTDIISDDVYDGGRTPLHVAVKRGRKHIIKILITMGVDINTTDEYGRTSLYNVRDLDCAELLIDGGVDRTMESASGNTAAQTIANNGLYTIAHYLTHNVKLP